MARNTSQEEQDVKWMRRAVRLARNGLGTVSPNPLVGAVIIRDGVLLGEGWHDRPGSPHAEINALASLRSPELARGATIYVTLEPCCTFGRTPPCCEAILSAGFARVVAGCVDPNPKHAGRGLEYLRSSGVEVTEGVCREACEELNESFFKWIRTKRPFVLLKMAETLDGRIATASGSSRWITGPEARKHVMKLRLWADAVLAGANTWRLDSPSFTARTPEGAILKTPRRFIAFRKPLALPEGWETVKLDSPADWETFLVRLGAEDVTSLLLEGGGELAASALRAGVVDKAEFHIAPKILGGRGSRPSVGGADPESIGEALELKNMRVRHAGCDLIVTGYPAKGRGGKAECSRG
ncbi:MAG: bifunctional diaminohydroxyphosphoribosylaminopyrimidine deaminase/5-amino-6-(5-phosphoribosylamino)uracil reductase RibD [Clostridia bacterium]|nr:bifunctional diaminohydroxyphosphoribosylaminopyrimidine deaminase/5-amino-6-(5-phosphoribosylamino)uracil reductase RibD [Clostridia bacterium]